MELKLSSGRVVEINRPSVRDTLRCEDIVVPQFDIVKDAKGIPTAKKVSMPMNNTALGEWAAVGLGVDLEELSIYSKTEREEIGLKVKEIASLNPESDPS